jgi:hypothetical protein
MSDKATSRRIWVQIRHVLLNVWDPIGIRDEPNAQDEYDGCLWPIFDLLSGGATDEQLNNRLLYFVNERMGLGATSEAILPTIRALRAIEFPKHNDVGWPGPPPGQALQATHLPPSTSLSFPVLTS